MLVFLCTAFQSCTPVGLVQFILINTFAEGATRTGLEEASTLSKLCQKVWSFDLVNVSPIGTSDSECLTGKRRILTALPPSKRSAAKASSGGIKKSFPWHRLAKRKQIHLVCFMAAVPYRRGLKWWFLARLCVTTAERGGGTLGLRLIHRVNEITLSN